ncbi:MAG: hypothetical protein HW416_2229 [Chloroflexi bacterium]|nr:hypothetical protein [Chloroflexota bacterium]
MQLDLTALRTQSVPRLQSWLGGGPTRPADEAEPRAPGHRLRGIIRSLAVLLIVAALSVATMIAPIDYRALGNYGYLGVFLVTLLGTASLVVPVPYLGAIFVGATFLNPTLVAVVAGVASAIGELTGYFVGATGRAVIPQTRWSPAVERAMARFGGPIIFLFAAIPNPVFDMAGIFAGVVKLPLWIFMISTLFGKTLRFWVIATFAVPVLAQLF